MSYNKSEKRVATYARKGQTMKELNIKLNGKNADERIKAEIEKVQTRCTARLICETAPAYAAETIEKKLNIPKKHLDGITAKIDVWATHFAGSYHGIPESTQFKIRNRKGQWYLIGVWRGQTQSPTNRYRLCIPEHVQAAIVDSFRHFGQED